MITKKTSYILLVFVILMKIPMGLQAQVTIGANEAPEKHAILQVKDEISSSGGTLGGVTATKGGLLLPRVELVKKHELLPFVLPSELGTTEYETVTKPAHTGLIVYNLAEIIDEDLSIGLVQWDGEKWINVQSKMGNAVGTISNCDSIEIYGVYKTETPLTTSSYVVLPMSISKAGAYNITVKPVTDNGFYFNTSGVFMAPGYYNVVVPGIGSPITNSATQNGDPLQIIFNEQVSTCSPNIFIEDSSKKPIYTMDCNRTTVYGSYIVDTAINPSTNYITMRLDVNPNAEGAFYSIETDEVDGVKFSGSGYLLKGIQTVTLYGQGKPTSVGQKNFTITSNSISNSSKCQATLNVAYKPITILTLGYKDALFDINNVNSGANKLVRNQLAFGPGSESKVQVSSIAINSVGGATGPSDAQLTAALALKPDIVLLTFDVYITTSQAAMYANYLNQGGVVLAYDEGNANAVQNLMRAVFPDIPSANITQRRINFAGAVYQLSNIDDDILNGPFGDVRGKHWGDDRSQAAAISGLPADRIVVYSSGFTLSGASGTGTTTEVTALKHKDLNFMWIGDGGFMAYLSATDPIAYPFILDATNMPAPHTNYGATTRFSVYNSTVYANALAWAIKCASQTGINVP